MPEKKSPPKTVDVYIARYPIEVQNSLQQIRQIVHEVAPQAEEKITYNMPGFMLNGFLVSFSAWKKHIGLYPMTDEMQAAIPSLKTYGGAKSSFHFPLNKPIPFDLIRQVVTMRVQENTKLE